MEPFVQPDSEHLLTRSSVPVPDVSRAPEILSVVVTCVGPLISRIGLALSVFPSPSFCLLVLLSPEDRLFLLIHGHEISLVDSAAEFGAFHSLVRDGFVWAPPVALPFLRGTLSTRTVLASWNGDSLSFLSTHVWVTVSSACCFLSWMSEDAFFPVMSSTSPQWSPVDFARMSSLAVLHRLGSWLEGFRSSASKLYQFCPIATLFRVCLPECSFPRPGPEEAFWIPDFWLYRSCLLPLCFIVPWLWLSRLTLWILWNRACRVFRRSPPRSPSFSARGIGSPHAFRRGGRGRLGCLSVFGVSSSSGPSPRLSIKSFLHLGNSAALSFRRFSSLDMDDSFNDFNFRCAWWLCFFIPRLSFVVFRDIPLSVFSFTGFFNFRNRGGRASHLRLSTVPGWVGRHVFSQSVSAFSLYRSGGECCLPGSHFTFSLFDASLPAFPS